MALNRAADLPDEAARWPVKMLADWNPPTVKESLQRLAVEIMSRVTGGA